jgi:hypothetical protein
MGTLGVPGTTAMMVVAVETKTPMISLTPTTQPQNPNGQWHSTAAAPDGRRGGRTHEKE